jgi:hypothetical protein
MIATEQDTISTMEEIQRLMDRLADCTTDSMMVFVNHWGRVCAKVESRRDGVIAGWGNDIQQAAQNLKEEILKIVDSYTPDS